MILTDVRRGTIAFSRTTQHIHTLITEIRPLFLDAQKTHTHIYMHCMLNCIVRNCLYMPSVSYVFSATD